MKHILFIFILFYSLVSNAQNGINMNINMNIEENTTKENNQNAKMNINLNIQESTPVQPPATLHNTNTNTVYVVGYNGKIGCTPPIGNDRITDMAKRVKNQTFNDDKVRVVKQIIKTNCITLDQLILLLNNFDWDDGKLEIAKFAYSYVYDLENYYKVYDLFTFSSSGEELEDFLNNK